MAQLVCKRSGEVVTVPDGKNPIGRGPLLKITDKRVSRNHAVLHYEKGKLSLCPRHTNPCFYKPTGQDRFNVLDKDVWQELRHGDCFSLLPNECVFQVVIGKGDTSKKPKFDTSIAHSAPPTSTRVVEGEPMCTDEQQEGYKPPVSSGEAPAETPVLEPNLPASISDLATQESKVSKKRVPSEERRSMCSTGKARKLPSWLKEIGATSKPLPREKRPQETVVRNSAKSSYDEDYNEQPPPSKVPKVSGLAKPTFSTEKKGEVVFPERGEDHMKALAKPADTLPASTSVTGEVPRHTATKETKERSGEKKLSPCPYGASCYRKNPHHFHEYSHSFSDASGEDSEVDDTDKPVCPYGADCYRRNPEHQKEYRHFGPPVTATGTRSSSRVTKGKKHSVLDGESDDDDLPNTYDRNDSFIHDEEVSEESSYEGDSEDSDWVLEKADGRAGTIPDEDIAELLNDAEEFISNKKMRRSA